jgi:hypothetical protein
MPFKNGISSVNTKHKQDTEFVEKVLSLLVICEVTNLTMPHNAIIIGDEHCTSVRAEKCHVYKEVILSDFFQSFKTCYLTAA